MFKTHHRLYFVLLLFISLISQNKSISQVTEIHPSIEVPQPVADSFNIQEVIPIEISTEVALSEGILALSRKEFIQLPGAFDDPSRLNIKYPGFATQNDQANFIIYDGLPSQFTGWAINGATIVNPNHLTNAGTITNRPSKTAGGVNALSGQVIANYQFLSQANSDIPSGTISGLSNISFRRPYKTQTTLNISLLGIEAGFDTNSKRFSTFMNTRYSTVGLLENLGVDFGDESIKYWEAIGGIHIKDYIGGTLSAFFMGGKSENVHFGNALATNLRDVINSDYESELFIGGLNYENTSEKNKVKISFNYSQRYDDSRSSIPSISGFNNKTIDDIRITDKVISNFISYSHKIGRSNIKLSSNFDITQADHFQTLQLGAVSLVNADYIEVINWLPQFSFHYRHSEQLSFHCALARFSSSDLYLTESTIEPKFNLSYQRKNSTLKYKLRGGASSQRQDSRILGFEGSLFGGFSLYQDLARTKARHLELEVIKTKNKITDKKSNHLKNLSGSLGLFAHYLYDIPHTTLHPYEYSYLSNLDLVSLQSGVDNLASAYSYGVKWQLHQKIKHWNISFNGTLFNMTQFVKTDINDFSFEAPLSYNWSGNLLINKELTKRFFVGLAFNARGGMREKEIDLEASKLAEWQVNQIDDPYTLSLAPYYRLDLRLNYKLIRDQKRGNMMISLDIQNVTHHQNEAYNYYDPITQSISLQRQLGLIPVLGIRFTL